jgi:hypothetical protein
VSLGDIRVRRVAPDHILAEMFRNDVFLFSNPTNHYPPYHTYHLYQFQTSQISNSSLYPFFFVFSRLIRSQSPQLTTSGISVSQSQSLSRTAIALPEL